MVETLLQPQESTLSTGDDPVLLLGRAMHRVRNMLMSVRGYAELMATEDVSDESRRRWASRIVDQIDRIEGLHGRLDRTRPQAQALGHHNLGLVTMAAARRSRQRLRGMASTIQVRAENVDDLFVQSDGEALTEALAALMDNAREAVAESKRSTEIIARIERHGLEHWSISVIDAASGLGPEVAARIGEPFFTRKAGHLGLGIFLSRTLLERHGLSLHLGNAPQGGTVATIRGRINASGGHR